MYCCRLVQTLTHTLQTRPGLKEVPHTHTYTRTHTHAHTHTHTHTHTHSHCNRVQPSSCVCVWADSCYIPPTHHLRVECTSPSHHAPHAHNLVCGRGADIGSHTHSITLQKLYLSILLERYNYWHKLQALKDSYLEKTHGYHIAINHKTCMRKGGTFHSVHWVVEAEAL